MEKFSIFTVYEVCDAIPYSNVRNKLHRRLSYLNMIVSLLDVAGMAVQSFHREAIHPIHEGNI